MAVLGKEGCIKVKVISPGVGASGYYSPDVLARDAEKFANAQCYWDHPRKSDESERPERSLRDLAGKVQGIPGWDENGPTGPGVYADVQVFGPYQETVEELAPHIGMSIRALGRASMGNVEGKKMKVIEGIDKVRSVDFVTLPGRGGEILQLFEAARPGEIRVDDNWPSITLEALKKNRPDLIESLRSEIKAAVYGDKDRLKEDKRMTEEKIQELEEQVKALTEDGSSKDGELARLRETIILSAAKDFVSEKMAKADLPDITKARLAGTLSRNPVLTEDGALDADKYSQCIDEAVKAEADYIVQITGQGDGKVKGMGPSDEADGKAQLKESLKRGYLTIDHMGEEEAERMADLAVNAR